MASYVTTFLFFFFFLLLSFSFETHARDINFFSRVAKSTMKTTLDSISDPPAVTPSLSPSPSPEPVVVERGYGLYGSMLGEEKYVAADELSSNEFYGNGNGNEYQYPPTTGNPTKTHVVGEEKYVAPQELSNDNVKGNENGVNDLRFIENEKYSFKGNEVNGYGTQKEGMSDTRFLENGKYYYGTHFSDHKYDNENFEEERHGMNKGNVNVGEKKGMSDTRFLENGKYYYDIKGEEEGAKDDNNFENEIFEEENHGMDRYAQRNGNGNGNGYVTEKQGMSDTRFLENGKYFYDLDSENSNSNELRNGEFNDKNFPNHDYVREEERKNNYVSTKKLPNTYDTMEEYDREQGYIDPKDAYVP